MTDLTGLKLIGKGAFTKCYQLTTKKVLLISNDPVKECMSKNWFPPCRLFPDVIQTDNNNEYTMKYYPRVTSLKRALTPRQYRLYSALRKIRKSNHMSTHTKCHAATDTLPSEFRTERELIKKAIDALSNYGQDICFEISPRNVAVQSGKLILLDCFFMKSELDKKYS